LATDMNATTSTSSDGVVGPGPMDDMDMASNVTDSASASADASEDEDGVTDGPPNSPTGASASSSEDTTAASTSSADCASITDTVCAMEGLTFFCDMLKEMMLIPASSSEDDNKSSSSSADTADSDDSSDMSNVTATKFTGLAGYRHLGFASDSDAWNLNDESEEFTLFVPTDAAVDKISTAFEKLSDEEAGRVIMFHMYKGMMLTSDQLECGEKIISMNDNGDASRTKCTDDNKYQNGNGNTKTGTLPEIATTDTRACNGIIHTLDDVMFPVALSQLEEADASSASASVSSDSDDLDDSSDMSNVTASKAGYYDYRVI